MAKSRKFLQPINLLNATSDPSPATQGDIYYNSTSDTIRFYDGSQWGSVGSGGGGGSSVTISDSAPAGSLGDLWFNSLNGKTYIYYDSAWVEIGGSSSQSGAVSTDVALSNSWWLGV